MLRFFNPDSGLDGSSENSIPTGNTSVHETAEQSTTLEAQVDDSTEENSAALTSEETTVTPPVETSEESHPENTSVEAENTVTGDLTDEVHAEEREDEHEELQPLPAFDELSREELLQALKDAIKAEEQENQKLRFLAIRDAYNKVKEEEIAQKRQRYIENGGEPEEFEVIKDETDQNFEAAIKEYQEKRAEIRRRKEKELLDNLAKKQEILKELKLLMGKTDTISASFDRLHELQAQWRSIGLVPAAYVDELWKNYHHHINNFYEVIKINKELRELDQKKNLELKTALCVKAEELIMEPSIRKSLEEYKALQNTWKEIGQVAKEQSDVIWDRFKAAGDKLFDRRREYIQSQEAEHAQNLLKKNEVISEAEQLIATLPFKTHQLWQEASDKLSAMLNTWKTIGYASKKDNEAAWKRFKALRDRFYEAKEEFYKTLRQTQNHNYKLKVDICMEVEALKESTEWKKAGERIKQLQEQWKTIGPVSKKNSEKLWNRFRKACDAFFEHRNSHFSGLNEEQDANLKLKEELLEKINSFEQTGDNQANFEALKNFQSEWMSIGHVPIKEKDRLHKAFRAAIDKQFAKLKAEGLEARKQLFRAQAQHARNTPGGKERINHQQHGIQDKIRKLTAEIQTWENNIGFLGASKAADELKRDIEKKIQKAREEISLLRDQINILRGE